MKLYISSYEFETFETSREILHFQKQLIDNRYTLVVEVDNPVIGQRYGFLDKDIYTLYLVSRFNELALDKLDRFPIDVHVFIQKSSILPNKISISNMQNIAWACLYDNEEDAKAHKMQ